VGNVGHLSSPNKWKAHCRTPDGNLGNKGKLFGDNEVSKAEVSMGDLTNNRASSREL